MVRIIILFLLLANSLWAARNLEPDIGFVGEEFKFIVRYWHSLNILPEENYPILYIYKDAEGEVLLGTFTPSYNDGKEPKDTTTYTMQVILDSPGTYSYRFEAYDRRGNKAGGPATKLMVGPIVIKKTPILEPILELPKVTQLHKIYPNISSTSVEGIKLSFDLAERTKVSLKIYNIVGQLVKVVDLGELHPGRYRDLMGWDLSNTKQEKVSSGVYFLSFHAGSYKTTQNIIVLRD